MDNCLVNILKDTVAEQKKINQRQFILILVLIAVIIFTNASWLIYESQFNTTNEDTSLYAEDSGLNVLGNENSINRGE